MVASRSVARWSQKVAPSAQCPSVSSPLEQATVIDGVVVDPRSNEVVLVMVETRPWDSGPDQLRQLREKTSAYLGLVVDGELGRLHPEAEGRRVRIQLECRGGAPTGEASRTVTMLTDVVGRYGVRLEVVEALA
jgi:anti-sigma-K factor RskA